MTVTEAGAELGEPHFDNFAVLTLTRCFGFGERLRLVRRTRRTQAVFREFVRRSGATQIRFGRVLFHLAQEKIARRDEGINFSGRASRCRTGRSFLGGGFGSDGRAVERKSLLHPNVSSRSCARLA